MESARKQNATQSVSGFVEGILLFEREDCVKIGDTLLHNRVCSLGEVIIRRDSKDDLDWPRRIKTFFQGNNTVAKMSLETVAINKTGMYELYFLICDPKLEGTRITRSQGDQFGRTLVVICRQRRLLYSAFTASCLWLISYCDSSGFCSF